MNPSDIVKLMHGPENWMTVEYVDQEKAKIKTVWLDAEGKLQRSPDWLPEDIFERKMDALKAPDEWVWRGLVHGHRMPVYPGRGARLITFPHPSNEDAVEMTVVESKQRQVEVVWFDKVGEFNQAILPEETLVFQKVS